jgi:hypothetical protein
MALILVAAIPMTVNHWYGCFDLAGEVLNSYKFATIGTFSTTTTAPLADIKVPAAFT